MPKTKCVAHRHLHIVTHINQHFCCELTSMLDSHKLIHLSHVPLLYLPPYQITHASLRCEVHIKFDARPTNVSNIATQQFTFLGKKPLKYLFWSLLTFPRKHHAYPSPHLTLLARPIIVLNVATQLFTFLENIIYTHPTPLTLLLTSLPLPKQPPPSQPPLPCCHSDR